MRLWRSRDWRCFALVAWRTFSPVGPESPGGAAPGDGWHLLPSAIGRDLLAVDQLSAPLLPWVALLYFLTAIATLDSRLRQSSFAWTLASEAIVLATFACKAPWAVIGLVALGSVPPYIELRARSRPARIYGLHMALLFALLGLGWALGASAWAVVPLFGRGVDSQRHRSVSLLDDRLVRTGDVGHGAALRDTARRRLCHGPARAADRAFWALQTLELAALFTAVYTAALALVQRDLRRFFCYLFLSHSALVLLGLVMVSPIGLTAGLCLWLSVGLALCGFGLTLRALEARRGRLSLDRFQGLYEHTPNLAMCFGLTGFASIGFPGSFGFVGTELLVDGAVETHPWVGIAIVIAAAINGIAVFNTYFRLFSGTHYFSTVSLKIGRCERYAVLSLAALILILGLVPQPGVASRYQAAEQLLDERAALAQRATLPAQWAAAALPNRSH